jgi:hypothetical protein
MGLLLLAVWIIMKENGVGRSGVGGSLLLPLKLPLDFGAGSFKVEIRR